MSAMTAIGLMKASAEPVPDLTLFKARKAFGDLEGWIVSEGAMALAEHEVEVEIEKRSREVSRLMLQAHLNRRGTGDVGLRLVVGGPGEAREHRSDGVDPRRVVSIFGGVAVRRSAYRAAGAEAVHPLDEEMALPERSFSYEVEKRLVEEVVRGPFEEAVESVEKTTGNHLAKRSVQQVTREAAEDFDAFYAQRKALPAKDTGPILVAAVDCKGIPVVKPKKTEHTVRLTKGQKANKKKMATVAVVFTQQPRIRTPEEVVASLFEGERVEGWIRTQPEMKRLWASLAKDKQSVLKEVVAEALARDPEHSKNWVGLTDGERALQMGLAKHLPGMILILDLIHALEYLWEAAHALHPEGSPEATAWVRQRALMVLKGKVSQVVKGMRQIATKRRMRGSRRKAMLKSAAYLYRNRSRMRYDEYLAKGFPIASGSVEGACKNLVKDRMERSGMRWQIPGAEAVLRLRALKLSGDWDAYWPFHIRKHQERLYGSRPWKAKEQG